MIGLSRALLSGAFALALAIPALAGEPPVPAQDAAAAAHEKLMHETVCRSLDDEDTGHHVRHRTCKTRAEWLSYDKAQNGQGYDPNNGRVVVKE
jgi:hypothetical protein